MKYNETKKKELLVSLINQAFLNDKLNNSKIEEISIELRTIPKDEKYKYHQFVKDFLDNGFKFGLGESNINLKDYEALTEAKSTEIKSSTDEKAPISDEKTIADIIAFEEISVNDSRISFDSLFQEVKSCLKEYLEFYKGYYILKLENDPMKNYKLIFLYEENYFFDLLEKKIKNHITDVQFIELNKFTENITDYDENCLCVLLLNSKSNDKDGLNKLHDDLKTIIDSFNDFDNYSFYKNFKTDKIEFEKSNVKHEFLKEIKFVNNTFLSNYELSFAEEKIIKKLCSVDTPLILYKILAKGFSGAKVLEVRPKVSAEFEREKKYIIKYDLLKAGKLKEEFDNFEKYIATLKGFNEYNGNYTNTLTHEGIRYNYAISDFSQESFSFNDIIKNPANKFFSEKNNVINNLFSISLMEAWKNEHLIRKKDTVGKIFSSFVDIKEIESQLSKVLGIILEDVEKDDLISNFYKIWNYQIDYDEKICHGDLHTDNFFIDEKGVYLIDFGFTGKHYSLIDYTALECSLKFKHCPLYLESGELIKIENELLSEKSFLLNHTFSSTTRKEILDLLSMINTIRNNSIKDSIASKNNLDYYISLFIMTIRQIKYPNMNQLYAYHSAKILSEYIIKQIGV